MKIKIELDDKKLIKQLRKDHNLIRDEDDATDTEILDHVQEFVNELKTVSGFSLILDNLDYFNY